MMISGALASSNPAASAVSALAASTDQRTGGLRGYNEGVVVTGAVDGQETSPVTGQRKAVPWVRQMQFHGLIFAGSGSLRYNYTFSA